MNKPLYPRPKPQCSRPHFPLEQYLFWQLMNLQTLHLFRICRSVNWPDPGGPSTADYLLQTYRGFNNDVTQQSLFSGPLPLTEAGAKLIKIQSRKALQWRGSVYGFSIKKSSPAWPPPPQKKTAFP